MFKKEHARYARFMACALAAMRYQSRFSVLAAGEFGSIQTRFRTFVWGAAPGVVLPSAPEPTHRAYKLGDSALPLVAKVRVLLIVLPQFMTVSGAVTDAGGMGVGRWGV